MKKSFYTVILQSQLGPRAGKLALQEEAETVSGELQLLGQKNRFSGSVLQNGKYLISGVLRARGEKVPYDAIFSLHQGRLAGGLVTRYGCWDFTGVKASDASREVERTAVVTG